VRNISFLSFGFYRRYINVKYSNIGLELIVTKKKYCTQCGQPNLELKEPFRGFISHSIGHYFHFDSKFFHTLIPLLTKPGQLTLDYLAGKRARYIHPFSLYIFVSIVYFLIAPHALDYRHHQKNAAAEKVVTLKDSTLTDKEDLEGLPEILADQITSSAYRVLSFKAQPHILEYLLSNTCLVKIHQLVYLLDGRYLRALSGTCILA